MNLDRKQLKAEARSAMRETKPSIFGTTLLMVLIFLVIEFLILKLQYPGVTLRRIMATGGDAEALTGLLLASEGRGTVLAWVLNLILSVMETIIAVGFTWACLCVSRRCAAGVGSLFDPFAFPFKVLWLTIVMSFFIWLWSLLLIIPGIIAMYRYSMATYILLDDPDKSVMECLRESKEMVRGHKGALFALDLSFLGWMLLCIIPFVFLYVYPYIEVTKAAYYNVLLGEPRAPDAAELPPRSEDWWAQ